MPADQQNRSNIETALRNAIQATFGTDEHIDLILRKEDDGHLAITVLGLTLDDDRDIVPIRNTYTYDANILIGFSGTIIAQNESQAEELFEEWAEELEITDVQGDNDISIAVQYHANHDLYGLDN